MIDIVPGLSMTNKDDSGSHDADLDGMTRQSAVSGGGCLASCCRQFSRGVGGDMVARIPSVYHGPFISNATDANATQFQSSNPDFARTDTTSEQTSRDFPCSLRLWIGSQSRGWS